MRNIRGYIYHNFSCRTLAKLQCTMYEFSQHKERQKWTKRREKGRKQRRHDNMTQIRKMIMGLNETVVFSGLSACRIPLNVSRRGGKSANGITNASESF